MIEKRPGYVLAVTFGSLPLELPFIGFIIALGGKHAGADWRVTVTHGAYGPQPNAADILKGCNDMCEILKKAAKRDITKLPSMPIKATFEDGHIQSWNFVAVKP